MNNLSTNLEFPELGSFHVEAGEGKASFALPKEENTMTFFEGKHFDKHNVIEFDYATLKELQVAIDHVQWKRGTKHDFPYQGVTACFEVWDSVSDQVVARVRTQEQAQTIKELLETQGSPYTVMSQELFVDGTVRQAQVVDAYFKQVSSAKDGKDLLKLFGDQTSFSYLCKYSSGDLQFIGDATIVALDLEKGWFRDDCQDDPIRFDSLVLVCTDTNHQQALYKIFLEEEKEYHVNDLPQLLTDMMSRQQQDVPTNSK